jgi:hypothetical protein
MARFACDEDGWRSDRAREDAREAIVDDVRDYFREEYADILRTFGDGETDDWPAAAPKIRKLSERVYAICETAFTEYEIESIIVDMVEGDL